MQRMNLSWDREYSGHGDKVHSLYMLFHPLRFIEAELGILWSWQKIDMDTQCIHLDVSPS